MSEKRDNSKQGLMKSRFSGETGRRLLIEVLSDTFLLCGIPDLPEFVNGCTIHDVERDEEIMQQGTPDNSIFVVLSGSFDISVNGRTIATRRVGTHIGEMALVDSTARRSATATAVEKSLVLNCPEAHFSAFANVHPKLWRRIAVELSRRLTERNRFIRAPRTEPVLFIGCSTEALEIAREIEVLFDHDPFVVQIWSDGVFQASKTPIEDLCELAESIDFAVILLTPDDKIESRNSETLGPRDNVIFELGLAIGAIGRSRTLLLKPRGVKCKIPTDLLGVKPIEYATSKQPNSTRKLGPACTEIRKLIKRLGPL